MQANQLAANQELVTSLFQLADNYMLMAPALVLASGALPSIFQWAVQGLQMREAEPLRKVITFLSHWTAPTSTLLPETDKQVSFTVHLSVYSFAQSFVQLSYLSIHPPTHPSTHPPIHPSLPPSVHPSIHPSIHLLFFWRVKYTQSRMSLCKSTVQSQK